jgi:23S rRNA pseudouridine2605 synthase
VRLAKYLASAGVAARRAAEEIIRAGRVSVGEATVTDPARAVDGSEPVRVDGRIVEQAVERVVYAVNKPAGVVSTARDPQRRPTVVSLVPSPIRLYPVGRLDADTTGLILLTNDGELAHRLTHPSFEVPRTYRAKVGGGPVRDSALRALRDGVQLDDGLTAPATVRRRGPNELLLTIHEGRKRQVKRMCAAIGHPVLALERVAFGPFELGRLRPGGYRRLTSAEVVELSAVAGGRPGAAPSSAARRTRPSRRRSPGRASRPSEAP